MALSKQCNVAGYIMLCWPIQMTDGKRIQNFGELNILESSRLKHLALKNSKVLVHLNLHCSFCQDKT